MNDFRIDICFLNMKINTQIVVNKILIFEIILQCALNQIDSSQSI